MLRGRLLEQGREKKRKEKLWATWIEYEYMSIFSFFAPSCPCTTDDNQPTTISVCSYFCHVRSVCVCVCLCCSMYYRSNPLQKKMVYRMSLTSGASFLQSWTCCYSICTPLLLSKEHERERERKKRTQWEQKICNLLKLMSSEENVEEKLPDDVAMVFAVTYSIYTTYHLYT